ncbi:MAG: hypothetical protein U0R49_08850 [Fimbriimonadales bacterium]
MKRVYVTLSLILVGAVLPTTFRADGECNWGSACVTESCAWECWTIGYGNWYYNCYTWTNSEEVSYCCRCSHRLIICACIPSPDTGEQRVRHAYVNDHCLNSQNGTCFTNNPNE